MRVLEKLANFPEKRPSLRGLSLEAYQLLQDIDRARPVLKVAPEGQNVAAIKRAFTAAAKVLGGSVLTQNADDGTILVKWSSTPRVRKRQAAAAASPKPQHSEEAIEKEAERLSTLQGESGGYAKQPDEVKRKLRISAKRNLSRGASTATP